MDEADYYQLGRTVDLLSTVHNVKQALIRNLHQIISSSKSPNT